ncbi:MAG: response regulator [Verrucomicrobiae bacterium]|nr:response regulator [Verrucomicrobiae bacterium]
MKGRILLVDDNVNLTTLLGKALTKCGYEAHAENDSTLAVNRVRELRPDLIVLDVMMPVMDGGDVLAELRRDFQLRDIPVIMLTALAQEAGSLARIGGGNCPVIGKPVELGVLVNEIERGLGRAAA